LLDNVLLHELLHGVCYVNVQSYSSNSMPVWFVEGIAELLPGIDEARTDTIAVIADGNPEAIKKQFGGSIQEGIELTMANYKKPVKNMAYVIASFVLGYLFKRSRNGEFIVS